MSTMRVTEGICGGTPCLKIEWEPTANAESQSFTVFSRAVTGARKEFDDSTPPKMVWRGEIAAETLNRAKVTLETLVKSLRQQPELSELTILTTIGGLAERLRLKDVA